jgi:hypothetical protein
MRELARTLQYSRGRAETTERKSHALDPVKIVIGLTVSPCRIVQSSTIDFKLCLGATSSEESAKRTKATLKAGKPLEKRDEIVANVIWRFLDLRGRVFTGRHRLTT